MTTESGNGWEMHLGDCLEVMRTLRAVEHVITDPPFEAEAHTKQRRARSTRAAGASELEFAALSAATRDACGASFARAASRWVVAFCQIEAIGAWRSSFIDGGLDWVRGGVWVKPNGMPQFTGDRPGQGAEFLAIAHATGRKRWNGGGRHAVWTVPLDHSASGGARADHPTIKPIALMLALVADLSDPGETILDPFAGSGTTGVASLRLGRSFIGVEKDPKFFALACERLRSEESGLTLQAARAGQFSLLGGRA